jgi:hypothetical protein
LHATRPTAVREIVDLLAGGYFRDALSPRVLMSPGDFEAEQALEDRAVEPAKGPNP